MDEIATINEKVQISLLRLLETRTLERLGGTRTISTNARIVAATNENLVEAVEQGRFREDLFFRLDIFQIALPPVRERSGDVVLLPNHLPERLQKAHRQLPEISLPMGSTLKEAERVMIMHTLNWTRKTAAGRPPYWVSAGARSTISWNFLA